MKKNKEMKKTMISCRCCPCLNRGEEEDTCNLDYDVELVWNKKESPDSFYASSNCELIKVLWRTGIFEPYQIKPCKRRYKKAKPIKSIRGLLFAEVLFKDSVNRGYFGK